MNTKRKALTLYFIALGLMLCWQATVLADGTRAGKPNVIVIFTDDQGYADLGDFGSPDIRTPHIDRMAAEGMRFTDFYSAASVCTPSRAALLTGCYPGRVGNLRVLFPRDNTGLNPREETIARMLKASGYATACIGKWHLGHLEPFLPTRHGFDSYFGLPYSNDMTIAPRMKLSPELVLREGVTLESVWEQKRNWVPLMRDEEVIEYPADQSTLTKRYTEEAIAFINRNAQRPFFLYLPHTMPHIPIYVPPAFEGTSSIGLYGDCIEEIDWSVGEIFKTLRALELEQQTLVIYTSDNGPWKLKGNKTDKVKGNQNRRVGGSAHPLRGHKFSNWEGGVRVPTVMWWPGRIPPGSVCREVACTIDILPTVASLSGAPLPRNQIDGASILPLMEGRPGATSPHAAIFYGTEAVRSGPWKLKGDELFNLSDDISERHNVARDHADVVRRLGRMLAAHKDDMNRNRRPAGSVPPAP